jgi:hypothetical protein
MNTPHWCETDAGFASPVMPELRLEVEGESKRITNSEEASSNSGVLGGIHQRHILIHFSPLGVTMDKVS